MGLVLKITGNEWNNESRDKRELAVYRELGYDVLVMAKGESGDNGREDSVDGFPVIRFSTRPLGRHVPDPVNRLVSLFLWSIKVRKIAPVIISGHDLLPATTIGWLSNLFRKKKAKLIYDSHEFEIGRNTSRSKVATWFIKHWERFIMKRCDLSIMVNETIADEVYRIHKLDKRPVVIRSTPDRWTIDQDVCNETRNVLLSKLSLHGREAVPFLIMYHGALTNSRGIEALIKVVSRNPYLYGVILGDGNETYKKKIHELIGSLNVKDRILVHPAVPFSELWKYVGAVDLSLMMIQATSMSYYYSLPNKFFESIQALTPVVSSNFPEMKRIIDLYKIGVTCDPDDEKSIENAVERMRTDMEFYCECKRNMVLAKEILCWENEKEVLLQAIKDIQ